MNIKYITYLFSGILISFLFASCDDNNNSTTSYSTSSKDAQIYSFSLVSPVPTVSDSLEQIKINKIFAVVNKTKFAIDQVSGTIFNPDSMPYGTVLNEKVLLAATFNPTYGVSKVSIVTPDSINGFNWNLSDSVYVGKAPISITPFSNAGSSKTYNLDIRIHKIDPDTVIWKQEVSHPAALGVSKTLAKDQKFYTYSIVSNKVKLYTSDQATINWKDESVSGVDATLNTESIIVLNDAFFAIDNTGNALKSNDGKTWAKLNNDKPITSILGILPEETDSNSQLLLTINEGGKYYFAKTKDLVSINKVEYLGSSPTDNEIPATFPLKHSSAYTNQSTNKNTRMLILSGGVDKTGIKELNTTWLVRNTEKGLDLTPFTKNSLFKGKGISLFPYNSSLYVLAANKLYISTTWGDTWTVAPSKEMPIAAIAKRSAQSVVVDNKNNIWIFGGVSESNKYLNDVWKGRLNKLIL